jgi:hypothetical protein
MTLVSQIITDAYRETNLVPLGATISSNMQTEALNRLNSLVMSVVGNEVADGLSELAIGGDFDQTEFATTEVGIPDNVRVMLNLSSATSLDLDPMPFDGQRLAVVDVSGTLGTYNLTLSGNGRNIEGASSLTLNTNSLTRQWLYRSDTGNWAKLTDLITSDQLPFPEEFDDFFIISLAARLNPRYGQTLDPASQLLLFSVLVLSLRARYHSFKQILSPDLDVRFDGLNNPRAYYSRYWSNDRDFTTGRPWPWL